MIEIDQNGEKDFSSIQEAPAVSPPAWKHRRVGRSVRSAPGHASSTPTTSPLI